MSRIHNALHDREIIMFIQFTRDVLEDMDQLFKLLRDPQNTFFNNYIVTKAAVTKLKSYLKRYTLSCTFTSCNILYSKTTLSLLHKLVRKDMFTLSICVTDVRRSSDQGSVV